MLQSFAAFSDRRPVPHRHPPQAVHGFVRHHEPLGSIAKKSNMLRPAREISQSRQRLPHGHVHDHEWIIVVSDIRRVPRLRPQTPHKSRAIRQRINRLQSRDKLRNRRIVERRNQPANIDLSQIVAQSPPPACCARRSPRTSALALIVNARPKRRLRLYTLASARVTKPAFAPAIES
jgi:hypothetical protein